LKKKHLCAGGTGKSTAVVRMRYDNEPESRQSGRRAVERQCRWLGLLTSGPRWGGVQPHSRREPPKICFSTSM